MLTDLSSVSHHPLFCVLYACCHCRWQVILTKRKSKLKEKRRNLWVGCNNLEVITKHSWHISPSVSFSDFRITSSPGRPAGYVVPNCQTHAGVSLKTLPLYFGKNCLLVLVDLWCYLYMMSIMWSRCVVEQCNCKSFFFCLYQKETFEGLSQEALSLCIQSLKTASALITQRKVCNYLELHHLVLCFICQAHRRCCFFDQTLSCQRVMFVLKGHSWCACALDTIS